MMKLLMIDLHCVLQLALNYTVATVTVTANSTVVYNTTNSTDAVYTDQQLSRLIGKQRSVLNPWHAVTLLLLHVVLWHLQHLCFVRVMSSYRLPVIWY